MFIKKNSMSDGVRLALQL